MGGFTATQWKNWLDLSFFNAQSGQFGYKPVSDPFPEVLPVTLRDRCVSPIG